MLKSLTLGFSISTKTHSGPSELSFNQQKSHLKLLPKLTSEKIGCIPQCLENNSEKRKLFSFSNCRSSLSEDLTLAFFSYSFTFTKSKTIIHPINYEDLKYVTPTSLFNPNFV